MKKISLNIFLLLTLYFSSVTHADPAVIINEGAVVFEEPDFDSDPKFKLHEGDQVQVSKRIFPGKGSMGTFVRIKVSDGQMGFISDAEFERKSGAPASKVATPNAGNKKSIQTEKKNIKTKAFAMTRYRGVSFDYVGYKEQTMGFQPMSNLVFYGFKMFGPNLLVDGDLVTEFNVNVFPGAPPFYAEATGNGTNGWIMHTDVMVESIFAQTADIVTYAGFGPMFKYDHYSVTATSAGKTNAYDLDDMILGAVFSAGFGLRLGESCLRTEFKYNWEKVQYWGLGTSLTFPF